MSILLAIVTIIAIVEGVVIVTSNSKVLQAKDCIGTWKSIKDETFIFYEGGSGKRNNASITWEIKENTLNVTQNWAYGIFDTTGYKVEKDKIISVDGKEVYYKVK